MKLKKTDRYIILFIVFIFQPVIERFIPPFKYFDEIVVLLFFAAFCSRKKRFGIKKDENSKFRKIIILGVLALLIIGLLGNVRSSSGQPVAAIIQDILSNCKMFVFVFSITDIKLSAVQKDKLRDDLSKFIRLLLTVLFICAVLSIFVNIGMTDYTEGTRYGLRAFQFIYNNPAGLNTYFYLFMIINSITLFKHGKLRKNATLFTMMGVIAWLLTLRSRAVAFAILYSFLYMYIVYFRKQGRKYKFRWYQVIIAAAGAALLGWDAIEKYFISNERVSRYQLMHKSFQIAGEYFPIGTGFGTYGTEASRAYYSEIYFRYNMTGIYGISPAYPIYIVDQYWFGIIGQFGYAGFALVLYMIYRIYRDIWSFSKYDKANQLAAFTLFMTSFFASLTAGTFIQASIIPSMLVLYLLRNDGGKQYASFQKDIKV